MRAFKYIKYFSHYFNESTDERQIKKTSFLKLMVSAGIVSHCEEGMVGQGCGSSHMCPSVSPEAANV